MLAVIIERTTQINQDKRHTIAEPLISHPAFCGISHVVAGHPDASDRIIQLRAREKVRAIVTSYHQHRAIGQRQVGDHADLRHRRRAPVGGGGRYDRVRRRGPAAGEQDCVVR